MGKKQERCNEKWRKILQKIKGTCNENTYKGDVGSSHGLAAHYKVNDLHIYLNPTGEILVTNKQTVLYNDRYDGSPETYIRYNGNVTFGVTDEEHRDYNCPKYLKVSYYDWDGDGWLDMPGIKRKTPMGENGVEMDILKLLEEALKSKNIDSDERAMLEEAQRFVSSILEVYRKECSKDDNLGGLSTSELLEILNGMTQDEEELRQLLMKEICRINQGKNKRENESR